MDADDFGEPQIYQRYIPSWYLEQINDDRFYVMTHKGFVGVEKSKSGEVKPLKDDDGV